LTTDSNKVFIVKLSNGNWPVLSRDKPSVERSLAYWKKLDANAKMVSATLSEDESIQDFADNLDLSKGTD